MHYDVTCKSSNASASAVAPVPCAMCGDVSIRAEPPIGTTISATVTGHRRGGPFGESEIGLFDTTLYERQTSGRR